MRSSAEQVPSRVPGSRRRPWPLPLAGSPRLARLTAELIGCTGADRERAVAELWAEVDAAGTPLIEEADDPDERIVTFLLRVDPDDDRDVLLQANRLTDPARPRATVLTPIPGTDIRALSLRMAGDWRASYQLTWHEAGTLPEVGPVTPADLRRHRATGQQDPRARRQFPARKAMAASSVVELPDAPPQPWRELRPEVPAGRLTRHLIQQADGRQRSVGLYLPPHLPPRAALDPAPRPAPDHDPAPDPTTDLAADPTTDLAADPVTDLAAAESPDLLVLLDGEVWRDQLPLAATLDNLQAEGRIPATAVLLLDAEDEDARWRDYAASSRFLAFLIEQALPWVGRRLPDGAPGAERTTIAGQSLGAAGALWAGLVAPDVFGSVIAQSPSLWWRGPGTGPYRPDEHRGRAEWLTDLARLQPPGARIRLEVGRQEWLLLEPARRMRDVLVDGGFDLDYREFNGGHDHACWWGGLADALAGLHAAEQPTDHAPNHEGELG